MKTQIRAQPEQSKQQTQQRMSSAPQAAMTATGFEDKRPQINQLKVLQALMQNTPRVQNIPFMSAKAESSVRSSDESFVSQRITSVDMEHSHLSKEKISQRMMKEELVGSNSELEPHQFASNPVTRNSNNTGLPDQLKNGIESLSGMSMDHVKVHYHSEKPAQLNAHAYAQGSEIHIGPGQQQHLPHEAWHVVQQAQGRVKPTMQMKEAVPVNDDVALEAEADLMGKRALQLSSSDRPITRVDGATNVIQRRIGVEAELSVPVTLAPVAAMNANDRIRAFLGGGVFYDTQLEPAANGFKKSADHGPLGTVIENARVQMDLAVQQNGHPAIPQILGGPKQAIMEFVTDPFDVSTNANRGIFRNAIGLMVTDIGNVFANATAGVQATSLNNCIVGLPPLADWQAFALANGLAQATGTAIHTNILQNMNDQLYVQMTMGVQLRRMQKFLKKVGRNQHLASQALVGDPNHAALVNLVTRHASDDARTVLNNTFGGGDIHNRRSSDSLRGYTALLLSYLYGSYVYSNVDIAKNMVAALSKTPLHIVQQEITVNKRPDQWTALERTNFQTAIFNRLVARLSAAPFQTYWVAGVHNAGLLGNWQAGWLPNVLNGGADSFAGDALNPGQLVLGPLPIHDHTIAPEDDPDSKTIVGGPGRPVGRSAPNVERSGVIATELRFIEERPTPGQLLPLVNRGIALVRSVN